MMATYKFEPKKQEQKVETIEVKGTTYEFEVGIKNVRSYLLTLQSFYKRYEELVDKNKTNENVDDIVVFIDEIENGVEDILDEILGEGAFNEIYEAFDEEIEDVLELVSYLFEILAEKNKQLTDKNKQKYVKSNAKPRRKRR